VCVGAREKYVSVSTSVCNNTRSPGFSNTAVPSASGRRRKVLIGWCR
jgi:hypothetical protein